MDLTAICVEIKPKLISLLVILYEVSGLDNWTRVNDQHEVVPRAKISRQRRIEFFISALGSREKEIFIHSWCIIYVSIFNSRANMSKLCFLYSFRAFRRIDSLRDILILWILILFLSVHCASFRALVNIPVCFFGADLKISFPEEAHCDIREMSKFFDRELFNNA